MQDRETLKQHLYSAQLVATVLAAISAALIVIGWFSGSYTPGQHFVLGLIMMATVLSSAIMATLRTVYGPDENTMSALSGWFITGCWIVSMTSQFAMATFQQ